MLPKGKFKSIVARHVKPETVDQQGPGIPQSKLNMKNFVIQRLYFTWQRNVIWVLAQQIRKSNVSQSVLSEATGRRGSSLEEITTPTATIRSGEL